MNIGSVEEMKQFAENVLNDVRPGKEAAVIGLSGDLGAGKTTFAQHISRILGVEETVTSPTFVIQKMYPLIGQEFDKLVHIDAYRIEDPHELEILRWHHTIADPKNIILIEWPEKVKELLPKKTKMIHFSYIDDENREVIIEK